MPSGFPLYYAGVAGEDMLDEFLVGKRELDHGQSSTMDMRRFLNVKYHQASVGRLKKIAGVCTIAVVLIIVMLCSVGSPSAEKIKMKTQLTKNKETKKVDTAEKQQPSFVLATNPDTPFELTLKCNTCALVSSSGMLLDSNAGSQIDSADCVFRLNSAPTLDFEEDVGTKTTVRVLSVTGFKPLITDAWQSALDSFKDLDYMILLGPDGLLCKNCTLTKVYQRFARYLENTELLQVTKEGYQLVRQKSKNFGIKHGSQNLPISTRFFTLNLARHVCSKLRVFGMELENPCERLDTVPFFYWDPESWHDECFSPERRMQKQLIQGLQRLQMESKIFHSWAQEYNIEFFYPSQKVT